MQFAKLLLAGVMTGVLGACASQPKPAQVAGGIPAQNCIRETGTRQKLPEGKCAATVSGRVYYFSDIQRSGATSVGDFVRPHLR